MIKFSLSQIVNQGLLFHKSIIANENGQFGCFNTQYAVCANKKFMAVKLRPVVISIKKMLTISSKVASFDGVFLTYAAKRPYVESDSWFYNKDNRYPIKAFGYGYFSKKGRKLTTRFLNEKRNILDHVPAGYPKYAEFFSMYNANDNFFLVVSNGLFGFVSNFKEVFVKHLPSLNDWERPTNYTRAVLPSIVFITKSCYNEYYNLFRVFFRKRIVCVRTFHLSEEVNINVGYCLPVNECSKIYDICESVFKYNFVVGKLEW